MAELNKGVYDKVLLLANRTLFNIKVFFVIYGEEKTKKIKKNKGSYWPIKNAPPYLFEREMLLCGSPVCLKSSIDNFNMFKVL